MGVRGLKMKYIYLTRHGQTDYNLRSMVQGRGINADLNDTGRAQAKAFFEKYKHIDFDKIYISSLVRTKQSMKHFIDLGIKFEAFEGLDEISWGIHEGKENTTESHNEYLHYVKQWQNGITNICSEGAETPEEVAQRQLEVIALIKERTDEKTILICMHGRAMRVFLAQLLNYPLSQMDTFEHDNLCLYKIGFTGEQFFIEVFNEKIIAPNPKGEF